MSVMNTLFGIQDASLRNILRGFQSNNNTIAGLKTLNHARKQVTLSDVKQFGKLLADSSGAKQLYGEPFPKHQRNLLLRRRQVSPVSFEIESQIQWARLRKHETKISIASKLISVGNTAILTGNFDEALSSFTKLYEVTGVSALLYRKLLFLYFRAPEVYTTKGTEEDLLAKLFDGDESHIFSNYVDSLIDYFDPRTDLVDLISSNKKRLVKTAGDAEYSSMHSLLKRITLPCNTNTLKDREQYLITSTSSLIDAFADLATLNSLGCWTIPLEDEIDKKLHACVQGMHISSKTFRHFIILNHDETRDQAAYRLSIALAEVPFIATYRQALDAQLSQRNTWPVEPEQQATEFFKSSLKLKHLSTRSSSFLAHVNFFDNPSSGSFTRTFAVMNRLNSGDEFTELSGDQIRLLLSQTTGFSKFLSIQELMAIREYGDNLGNDVVSFLAMIVLHSRAPNDDEIYEMRRAFQALLKEKFRGSILEFLKWLKGRTPELCINIILLCEISFLEKCYIIFENYEQVLKERESICRWAALELDRPDFELAADRLALDTKVRTIRGDIDDTRIYVDEVRFGVWLTDNTVKELRKVQRFMEVSGLSKSISKNKKADNIPKPKIPQGCLLHLEEACKEAYREFCENTVFGINSYLSRRIRHGTFRGQLFSPVKTRVQKYFDTFEQVPDNQEAALLQFLEDYKQIVAKARSNFLHFKSESKPNGVLNSKYDSSHEKKRVKENWHHQVMSLFENGHSSEEIAPLFERYCWVAIEYDLSKARSALRKVFTQEVRPLIRSLDLGSHQSSKSKSLLNDIDRLTEELFSNIASWFNRPERKSMTVSIGELIQVTAEEINELDPDKKIKIAFKGDLSQKLVGSVYHTMYDLLYVFFGNLQSYSDLSEDANLAITIENTGEGIQTLHFSIENKFLPTQSKLIVEASLTKAFKETKSIDPMISEGKSGLGKVGGLVSSCQGKVGYRVTETHVTFNGFIRIINTGPHK